MLFNLNNMFLLINYTMSFVLLAIAPLVGVSFGAGYLYGTSNTQTIPKPPLPPALITEIQKGVPLKHVDYCTEKKIIWTDHDSLLKEIHNPPVLKKITIERTVQNDCLINDLKSRLKSIRSKIE